MLFNISIFTPFWKSASAWYNFNALKTKNTALQTIICFNNRNSIEQQIVLQSDDYKT